MRAVFNYKIASLILSTSEQNSWPVMLWQLPDSPGPSRILTHHDLQAFQFDANLVIS
jgi:hypothetical protein